uniref:Uncharacterized protein n=1 Tax=Arundo donax TaxID=35708 RepID=A0A0A9CF13_ARUDO
MTRQAVMCSCSPPLPDFDQLVPNHACIAAMYCYC